MTAAAIAATAPARVDVGWVVSSTIRVITRRSLDLLILGLPFIILPGALGNLFPPELGVLRLVTGLPGLIFIGGASLMTYRELSGADRLGLGAVISAGARRFGTLWGIAWVSNVATLLGALLLLVPGIIVAVGWMPASTAAMVEDKRTFEALDEAWRLTSGSRWRLFGLLCIALAAAAVLVLVVVAAGAVLGLTLGPETGQRVGEVTVAPLFAFAIQTISTVGAAAAYAGLRRAKEGAFGVAEVFA